MQGEWLSDYFLLVITQVTYWANPENGWETLMLPHIPTWSIVTDRAAIVPFYEGTLGTGSIPWSAWITPFFWWGTFLGALLLASFCLSIMLRKQWTEHERLAFPIAAALLELTGVSGSKGTLQALVRTRLFRIGFWSVFSLLTWNIGGWFAPALPAIPMLVRHTVSIARGFPSFRFKILPMTIGFGYFTRSEVLLSIWLFHLLAMLQVGILNRVGFDMGSSDPWCSFHPAIGWQSFGGMIIFVAWGLWIARAHLGEVFKAALTLRRTDRDESELMSYGWAVRLLLASSGYMVLWLRQAGMEWGPLFAFGLASGILYVGLARIIVESGLVYLRGPITSQAFTWHLFGMTGMGPASAVVLGGLSYTFFCDAKTFGMTMLAHVPRLGDAMSVRYRRGLVPAVLLGALVGGRHGRLVPALPGVSRRRQLQLRERPVLSTGGSGRRDVDLRGRPDPAGRPSSRLGPDHVSGNRRRVRRAPVLPAHLVFRRFRSHPSGLRFPRRRCCETASPRSSSSG